MSSPQSPEDEASFLYSPENVRPDPPALLSGGHHNVSSIDYSVSAASCLSAHQGGVADCGVRPSTFRTNPDNHTKLEESYDSPLSPDGLDCSPDTPAEGTALHSPDEPDNIQNDVTPASPGGFGDSFDKFLQNNSTSSPKCNENLEISLEDNNGNVSVSRLNNSHDTSLGEIAGNGSNSKNRRSDTFRASSPQFQNHFENEDPEGVPQTFSISHLSIEDKVDNINDSKDGISEVSDDSQFSQVAKQESAGDEILDSRPADEKLLLDNKCRSDEALCLRDELDFEADRESAEEGEDDEKEEGEDDDDEGESIRIVKSTECREEGELSDDEDGDNISNQEPKTVCRFFNKGQCTWGTNCRFLHPGVSDKGNYNMFAPVKAPVSEEKEEEETEKEKPREVRRYFPEASPFESSWERGLGFAKEMSKRANKKKETDADFEEKRLYLSVGQAELDRENDYYTRPASPVYKPPPVTFPFDEVADPYLDPYEKQAIRHFRGGHFENFEVRYHVVPNMSRGKQERSRRYKYEREVSERTTRKPRLIAASPPEDVSHYPRKPWQATDRYEGAETGGTYRGEAEAWADPWARRKTPPPKRKRKKNKIVKTPRSYSSGSSSRSSRTSRSTSCSSYDSRSSRTSRSRSRSSRSRSSSRSPSPVPISRNRFTGDLRDRLNENRSPPFVKEHHTQKFPPTGPYTRPPIPRRPIPEEVKEARNAKMKDVKDPRILGTRESTNFPVKVEFKQPKIEPVDKVDSFGRIRREKKSPVRSRSRSATPVRQKRRKFSLSPSRSHSPAVSRSSSSSRSRSRGCSLSGSRSDSVSSSRSSSVSSIEARRKPPTNRRKVTQGTVSYGQAKHNLNVPAKSSLQRKQIKMTLKGPPVSKLEKPVLSPEDDSGESETETNVLKKRKAVSPQEDAGPFKVARKHADVPNPEVVRRPMMLQELMQDTSKRPSRKEELLKQLRAVEDAIMRKRSKLPG